MALLLTLNSSLLVSVKYLSVTGTFSAERSGAEVGGGGTTRQVLRKKIMIRVYQPMTFVQTDKPIHLPGQTGNDHKCF